MSGSDSGLTAAPRVTVIMNCYNGERYLREALDSVYAQTMTDWEIVFWDNQSTDGSAELARARDTRLRYFRAEERTPLSRARGLALQQARGEFVAFLDVDDAWLPDTLAVLVAGMEDAAHRYAVCYGGYINVDSAGKSLSTTLYPARSGLVFDAFLRQFEIMPCAVMLRRSVLAETGLSFDPNLTASEEYCLFMQLAVTHPFHALPRVVARYRIHDGALTNKSIANWADEWEFTLNLIEQKHPGIATTHALGFRHARARVDYYRARLLMHQRRRSEARPLLWRNRTLDRRYLFLALVAWLPTCCWNLLHALYHRRRSPG